MRQTRILERAATALAIAAIAAGALALVRRPAPDALAPEAVAEAASRLESAEALRRDTRRENQFDAIVGSLAAGVRGGDSELVRAVERVREARERERVAGARGDEVDAALDGLAYVLGRASISSEGARERAPVAGLSSVALGAAALVLAGLARRRRRRETDALKAALDIARRYPIRVRTEIAVPAPAAPAIVSPAVQRDEPIVATGERRDDATPFGTILEVVAVDDESTTDSHFVPSRA